MAGSTRRSLCSQTCCTSRPQGNSVVGAKGLRIDGEPDLPKPKDTCWRIDSHTLAKHRILRGYLQAWLPIVGTSFPRIRLIDGFAGPGHYADGEPGSPIIMLRTYPCRN
jgi:hypothetical protein